MDHFNQILIQAHLARFMAYFMNKTFLVEDQIRINHFNQLMKQMVIT